MIIMHDRYRTSQTIAALITLIRHAFHLLNDFKLEIQQINLTALYRSSQ